MTTIRDIAARCQVSPMTVSYVLNDKRGQVSEETRQRVLQAVREMGYRPRLATRKKPSSIVNTIGIGTASPFGCFIEPGYFQEVLTGIFATVDRLGLNLLIFHRTFEEQGLAQGVNLYHEEQCDGILFLAPTGDSPVVPRLAEMGTPLVLLGTQIGDVPTVDVDNREEFAAIVGSLVALGHQRIAFLGGPTSVQSAQLRLEGFQRGMERAQLPIDPETIFAPIRANAMVYQLVVSMMSRTDAPPPTAIVCWDDETAVRALMALKDLGIAVPDRVSVVGFDDSAVAATAVPRLTTYRQPYFQLGERAVEMLLQIVNGEPLAERQVFLPTERVNRQTVGPPPV